MAAKKPDKRAGKKRRPDQVTKPKRYTIEQMEKALRSVGGVVTAAASKLKCSPSTVRGYINEYPYLRNVLEQIQEENLDLGEGVVLVHMRQSNLEAAKFYLRHKGKARGYGVNEPAVQVNVPPPAPGAPSGPAVLVVPGMVSEEEWLQRAQRYQQMAASQKVG